MRPLSSSLIAEAVAVPSSLMATEAHGAVTKNFLSHANPMVLSERAVLKIVCFDSLDYDWAMEMHHQWPLFPMYLSAGTEQDGDPSYTLASVTERYRWLCDEVRNDPHAMNVVVLPQLHVVAWGPVRGV